MKSRRRRPTSPGHARRRGVTSAAGLGEGAGTTDTNVQILALQYQTGRCGAPDVLAGQDDPDLPLVTCSQDGKYVYLLDRALLTGDGIATAHSGHDSTGDDYDVEVEFTPDASSVWAKFTAANVGTQVAFTIDTRVATAPQIREAIPDGRLQIAGFDADPSRLWRPCCPAAHSRCRLAPQLWTMPRVALLAGGIVVALVVVTGGVLIARKT